MYRPVTVAVVFGVALLAAAPTVAKAQVQGTLLAQVDDSLEYETGLRANVHRRAFSGSVTSEFTEVQEVDEAPGCIEDRTVQLFVTRKNRTLKRVGSAVTDEEGRWRIRTDVLRRRVYVVRVLPQEFLYSPYYGRLERAVCLQERTSVRPSRVLGVRLARQGEAAGATGGLARTGAHHGWWLGLGLLLMAIGELLRRTSSVRLHSSQTRGD